MDSEYLSSGMIDSVLERDISPKSFVVAFLVFVIIVIASMLLNSVCNKSIKKKTSNGKAEELYTKTLGALIWTLIPLMTYSLLRIFLQEVEVVTTFFNENEWIAWTLRLLPLIVCVGSIGIRFFTQGIHIEDWDYICSPFCLMLIFSSVGFMGDFIRVASLMAGA